MSSWIAFLARVLLVLWFLPFSALDTVLNFSEAVAQASQTVATRRLAMLLIAAGFTLEVTLSMAILTGVADRLAAVFMSAYCVLTAVLWKQFWKIPGFSLQGASPARGVLPYWRDRRSASRFLGIDHSAISVAVSAVSTAFYRTLGLEIAGHSFNHGEEQQRLDGVTDPMLDVTALAPRDATPHVERLCYRQSARAHIRALRSRDVGASRLIFDGTPHRLTTRRSTRAI